MSVIVELTLPSQGFELGQILGIEEGTKVVLETVVPVGEKSVPFVRVFDGGDQFADSVQRKSSVEDIQLVSSYNGESLYALDWDATGDRFFQAVKQYDGNILESTGTEQVWNFEVRFEGHAVLSDFQEFCHNKEIPIEIERLFNPTNSDVKPRYGLTEPQRKALARAVEAGYYHIPRQITTKELASEFDISDQALSERLRRAIVNLVKNTVHEDGIHSG